MKKAIVSVFLAVILALFALSSVMATTGNLMVSPKFKEWSIAGKPLVGGLLYSYKPGTSTPKPLYSDRALTTPITQPVVLDGNAFAAVGQGLWGKGCYYLVLKTSAGVQLWDQDNYCGFGGGFGGDFEDISTYDDNMCQAVRVIGATTKKTVVIGHPINETAGCTATSNLTWWLPDPGTVTVSSGKTVTILGALIADQKQKFPGTGTWSFLTGIQNEVWADWWGDDNASIENALASITTGTVNLTAGKTYAGDVSFASRTARKALNGNWAIVDGSFVVNRSKDLVVSKLLVTDHMEVNGCWRCLFEDITIEEAGALFSGTAKAGQYLLVTDSDSTSDFGTYWNRFVRINAHGARFFPGLNGSTSNNGINSNHFINCLLKSALASGTGLYDDSDNASIRVVPPVALPGIAFQANIFTGCDLSDSPYLVKNETQYELYIDGGSYCESYDKTHTGLVEFKDSYIYTGLTHATPGDNDTQFSLDTIYTTANRSTTGGAFYPATEIYGNPHLMQWEWNTEAAHYIPKNITGSPGSTYDQCGSAGTVTGSTLEMYEDTVVDTGNQGNLVLRAVGGTAAPCSVRFLADKASQIDGHVSAAIFMRGTGMTNSKIGFNEGDSTSHALHGSQSADEYKIFWGSTSYKTDQETHRPFVQIDVAAGETVYISQVFLSRGKTTAALSVNIPYRVEAYSATGPPTTGYWPAKAVIWNAAGDSYVEAGRTIQGTPMGWLVTVAGTLDDGNTSNGPTLQELGQIGMREIGSTDLSSTKSQRKHEIAISTTGSRQVWIADDDNGTTWTKLSP